MAQVVQIQIRHAADVVEPDDRPLPVSTQPKQRDRGVDERDEVNQSAKHHVLRTMNRRGVAERDSFVDPGSFRIQWRRAGAGVQKLEIHARGLERFPHNSDARGAARATGKAEASANANYFFAIVPLAHRHAPAIAGESWGCGELAWRFRSAS